MSVWIDIISQLCVFMSSSPRIFWGMRRIFLFFLLGMTLMGMDAFVLAIGMRRPKRA